jgi:hypothetical protein
LQTAAVQGAYDVLAGADGGALRFAAGEFRVALEVSSRGVALIGASSIATTIKPATAAGVAVRATYADAPWDPPLVAEIGFEGIGTRQGSGFVFGPDVYSANAEYVGRTLFNSVRFSNFDKCIERPRGNIGFWLTDGQFETANYHLWTRANVGSGGGGDGDQMHAGTSLVLHGHMEGAEKASVYIDGRNVPCGQVVFDSVIMEHNPGWCFYIKDLNTINSGPGVSIRSCWNESNYTSGSVTVEGDTSAPGWGKFDNCGYASIVDTLLGPVVLRNGSFVSTDQCDLSKLTSYDIDADSSLVHDRARLFTGTSPLVRSFNAPGNFSMPNSPWFQMSVPVGIYPYNAKVLYVSNAQAVEAWGGSGAGSTTPSTTDPGIPWLLNAQDIAIANGNQIVSPSTFTIPGDVSDSKFGVSLFLAKLTAAGSLSMRVNGNAGFGGGCTINNTEWRLFANITKNTSGADITSQGFYVTNASGSPATLRIGGYAFVSFATLNEAIHFANLGLFPVVDRGAYTITNVNPDRAYDANATTLDEIADVLGTLIADLKAQGKLK